MNDIFGKVVSLFLAAIIFFGMPLVYMNERAKTAEQLYLLTEVTHFVDSACNTGYVSGQMLRDLNLALSNRSSLYQIGISHEQPEYVYDEECESYVRCESYRDEEDIWSCVEQGENYYFHRGDFLTVTVKRQAGYVLWPGQTDPTVSIRYGGCVKYEAY